MISNPSALKRVCSYTPDTFKNKYGTGRPLIADNKDAPVIGGTGKKNMQKIKC